VCDRDGTGDCEQEPDSSRADHPGPRTVAQQGEPDGRRQHRVGGEHDSADSGGTSALGAVGSGTGSVLESTAVRRSGAFGGSHDDLAKVARHPLYWTGVLIDIGGFLCAAVALRHLPLFLVQSVLACSVAVTAAISAAIGVRMARTGWLALVVAAVGLMLVGVSAATGRAHTLPAGWRWILLALAVVVTGIGRYGDRVRPPALGVITLAFGAGPGFAAVAVSARTWPCPSVPVPSVAATPIVIVP
jgi:hypothetical membrane protein